MIRRIHVNFHQSKPRQPSLAARQRQAKRDKELLMRAYTQDRGSTDTRTRGRLSWRRLMTMIIGWFR